MAESRSIPADARNGGNAGSPTDGIYWGDDGRTMGNYIGMLATEYRLLKNSGQDVNENIWEMFFALHALYRLDSAGMASWCRYPDFINCSNNWPSYLTFPGAGFMISDDVDSNDLLPSLQNAPDLSGYPGAINYFGTYVAVQGSGVIGPVNSVQSNYRAFMGDLFWNFPHNIYDAFYNKNYFSQDNYIGTLMGLCLAVKCLDPGITSFTDPNTNNNFNFSSIGYPDLRTMAQELGQRIYEYMYNENGACGGYELQLPDGTCLSNGEGGDATLWEYPLAQAANIFFNTNSANNFTLISYEEWKNAGICWYDATCHIQNLEMACELSMMSNDGGPYGNFGAAFQLAAGFGNFPSGLACIACENNYANQYGWDLFYEAINDVLFPPGMPADFCDMQELIYSAPPEGPFSHTSDESDHATCGWASDKRFSKDPPEQEVGAGAFCCGSQYFVGNYNGLDYMLFYNLYYLVSMQQAVPATVQQYYPNHYAPPYPQGWANVYSSCSDINIENLTMYNQYDPNNYLYNVQGGNGGLVVETDNMHSVKLIPQPGDVIHIELGAYFHASCVLTCEPNCIPTNNSYYSYQPDPDPNGTNGKDHKSHKTGDTNNNNLPPYIKTEEFDTAFAGNSLMNYPNPFNSQTTIDFTLKNDGVISIYITDMNGKKIVSLISNEKYTKGGHTISYNGSALAQGTYMCVVVSGTFRKTIKIAKTK